MTRTEIRAKMLKIIQDNLESEILTNLDNYIDEETVYDFMWEKDFGQNLLDEYIEENCKDIIADYLENIYEEITTDELKSPNEE